MIITRRGKCTVCEKACTERREFSEIVDMFEPDKESRVQPHQAEDIKKWRDSPIFCKEHINIGSMS